MNILIAPNSMKGSLSAMRFAELVGEAFQEFDANFFNIRKIPIADGGDHTADVLIQALNLEYRQVEVFDPLGRNVIALYGFGNELAIIEMANSSGLKLLKPSEYNPIKTSSYGTGQQIDEALKQGAKKILIGVGGSATVDCGMGMLEALGINFFDSTDNLLSGNGENMGKIVRIDSNSCFIPNNIEILVVADVDNYLLGAEGAAQVFGPQKGADFNMVMALESNLAHFSNIIQIQTGVDISMIKGSGAAGGMAGTLLAFFGAKILTGSEYILDLLSVDSSIEWADFIITGEGKIDRQTTMNKAPYELAKRAKKLGKPVVVLAGSGENPDLNLFDEVFELKTPAMSLDDAIENAEGLCYKKALHLAMLLKTKKTIG